MSTKTTTTPTITKLLYDRRSAAFSLSVSTRSLDYLFASKQLKPTKLGSKVMVHHKELERFANMDHHGGVMGE